MTIAVDTATVRSFRARMPAEQVDDLRRRIPNGANGRSAVGFHARDVHLVIGPGARARSVPFRIRVDGQAPVEPHGADVDESGNRTVAQQRFHQLIRQQSPISERLFEIEFLGSGVEALLHGWLRVLWLAGQIRPQPHQQQGGTT